jgi:hypothetical protein
MPRNKTRGTSIWNLYTINKYFLKGSAKRGWKVPTVSMKLLSMRLSALMMEKVGTGRSFELRAVIETTVWVTGGLEPRGVKTMFPLRESTMAATWFPSGSIWRKHRLK